MRKVKVNLKLVFIISIGLVFLTMFYMPVIAFIVRPIAEAESGQFWIKLKEVLTGLRFRRSLQVSLIQASLSSLISILMAFPVSYITSRYNFRLARLLRYISIIPFVLPSIVVIVAMLSLYGKNGLINRLLGTEISILYGLPGILLSHIFYNVSIAHRFLEDGWKKIDVRYRQISKSLGEGKLSYIKNIVIPEMMPYIMSSFFIVFIYSFLSFAVVLVFGGISYSTLEVQLYKTFTNDFSGITPSIYAMVQFIISIILISLLVYISNLRKRKQVKTIQSETVPLKYYSLPKKILINGVVLLLLIFLLLPIVSLFLMSFEKNGSLTLMNYINLFNPSGGLIMKINMTDVLAESLSISIPAGFITVILCLIFTTAIKGKKSNLLEIYMLLPIGISIVSLSYGVLYIFGDSLSQRMIIIIIHSVLAFPISLRLLKYSVDKTPDSLIFIARSLGASRMYAFLTVELPMYSRGIANALSYAIAISLSEITAVMVIGRGGIETIPMTIYKFINNYQFGQALSLSCIYILLLFVLFSIIDRQVLRRS